MKCFKRYRADKKLLADRLLIKIMQNIAIGASSSNLITQLILKATTSTTSILFVLLHVYNFTH